MSPAEAMRAPLFFESLPSRVEVQYTQHVFTTDWVVVTAPSETRIALHLPLHHDRTHELRYELRRRLVEIAQDPGAPEDIELLVAAFDLGEEIIQKARPDHLNVALSPAGTVLFSLFGVDGREVDVWVEESNGYFSYVASVTEDEAVEGVLALGDFDKLAAWLKDEGTLP